MFPRKYEQLEEIYNSDFRLMPEGVLLKKMHIIDKRQLKSLMKKKPIDGVILPDSIYYIFDYEFYAYTQHHAAGYKKLSSFSDYERRFSDREILEFFRSLLLTEKKFHEEGIVSGDITYSNIIMNEELKYFFIDFDYAFVDHIDGFMSYFSNDEIPFALNCDLIHLESIYNKKELFQYYDKANLINMILHTLFLGNFPEERILPTFSFYDKLNLPKAIQGEFEMFLKGEQKIAREEYLLDVFDDMIKMDYPLPYRKTRK